MLNDLRENKVFYRQALLIMAPVMVQSLIASIFSFVDGYMVSWLGPAAMSGVSVASKPQTVFTCVFFGFVGASGLMISQYYGAEDKKSTQQLFALQIFGGLTMGMLMFFVLTLFPRQIVTAFVSDEANIQAALDYLSIIKFTYLPISVSWAVNYALRVTGKNRFVMITGFVSALVNILFNALLIYGILGFPRMGVKGAALASLIARFAEMTVFLIALFRRKTPFEPRLYGIGHLPRTVIVSFLRKSIPLTITSAVSTIVTMAIFWSYSHVDEYALPALSLMDQALVFLGILEAGLAPPPIIGITLGAGETEKAKKQARSLVYLTLFLGAAGLILGVILAVAYPIFYEHLEINLRQMAGHLILIQSVMFIPRALYSTIFAILRAGGDMRSVFWLDAGYMAIAVVPVAVGCVYLLPLLGWADMRIAVVAVLIGTNIRTLIGLKILRRGHWAQNLTQPAGKQLLSEEQLV